MHSCKETKEQLTELVLDGRDYRSNEVLSAELKRCCECRAEFDALNAALRITTRLRETAVPPESYWTGYHAKLRQKLAANGPEATRFNGPSLLTRFLKYSVPVPAPIGVALIIVCAVLIPLSIRAARQQTPPAQNATIVRVPVEVPVIQEKIVTRVVYRNRSSRLGGSKRSTAGSAIENTFARSRKPVNAAASLTGFKPTEEVKLTVFKGGFPDEK